MERLIDAYEIDIIRYVVDGRHQISVALTTANYNKVVCGRLLLLATKGRWFAKAVSGG
jgi:hypothetical protein